MTVTALLGSDDYNLVHLLGRQQGAEVPRVPGLSAPLAPARGRRPFPPRVRRIGRGRSGGVRGVLADAGFQFADALLQRADLGLQTRDERLGFGGECVPEVRRQRRGSSVRGTIILRRYGEPTLALSRREGVVDAYRRGTLLRS